MFILVQLIRYVTSNDVVQFIKKYNKNRAVAGKPREAV